MKKILPVFITLVAAGTLFSCTKKEQKKEEPVVAESQSYQDANQDSASAEKYYFEADMEFFSSLKQGDTFEIKTKNQEMNYSLQVRRVQETIPGITSISANIENKDTGLATLLLRDRKLTGMLDLYREGIRYRVQYDSTQKAHYLQKVLPEEMDALEGGKPLIPGENRN